MEYELCSFWPFPFAPLNFHICDTLNSGTCWHVTFVAQSVSVSLFLLSDICSNVHYVLILPFLLYHATFVCHPYLKIEMAVTANFLQKSDERELLLWIKLKLIVSNVMKVLVISFYFIILIWRHTFHISTTMLNHRYMGFMNLDGMMLLRTASDIFLIRSHAIKFLLLTHNGSSPHFLSLLF